MAALALAGPLSPGESIRSRSCDGFPHEPRHSVLRRDIALASLSGALLAGSMSGEVSGLLAWVALAPLVIAVAGRSAPSAAGLGGLAGVVSSVLTYRWVLSVPGFGPGHAALLAVWLGLFPAVWCATLGPLARTRAPAVAVAPLLWVLLEWVRAHAGFLAFPWGSLAQTQGADLPLLQVAAVAGEPGLSFLVAAAGVALGRVVIAKAWREAAAVAALVALAHAVGALALASAGPGPVPGLRVAIVQPSILAAERTTEKGYRATVVRLERLTREAGAAHSALVVWPETAVRGISVDAELRDRLGRLAGEVGAPILAGSSTTEKFVDAGAIAPRAVRHNEAVLLTAHGDTIAPYRKTLLVPFVEVLPLDGRVRWPAWLTRDSFGIERGAGPKTFSLPDGTRVTAVICWENLFSGYVRRAVSDGARMLVVLTNDAWAGRSAAPLEHNAVSVLRAVETGVPVIVASNAGPSVAIDPQGRVIARAKDIFTGEVVTAAIAPAAASTPYARRGDPLAAVIVLTAAAVLAAIGREPEGPGDPGPRGS
ncbi:MAG: apolipoprotein N-acyltransferase [Candidatus Methylomirabilia bacterium]